MPPRARKALVEAAPRAFSPFSASPSPLCSQCLHHARAVKHPELSRSFSSSPAPQATRMRRTFYNWLEGPGAAFKEPLPGSTNYLSAYNANGELYRSRSRGTQGEAERPSDLQPYPENDYFRSQTVLSEEHKDAIWKLVKEEGKSVREVSNLLGVEMNRVGAVVRLKAVEKNWINEGKPLANAYNRAVMDMLPVTPFTGVGKGGPISSSRHESINDLNVHRATKEQIFFPASESRHFTREDAGSIFEKGLLPADKRIPHPEAIEFYKGTHSQELREHGVKKLHEFYADEGETRAEAKQRRLDAEKRNTITVEGDRAVFRITNVTVDEHTVGKDGRGERGVGWRYGLPHQDRKKGQVKIPTSVR